MGICGPMEHGWVTRYWGLGVGFKEMAENKAGKAVWIACTVRMANSKAYRSPMEKGEQISEDLGGLKRRVPPTGSAQH